jgi:hypothetical protein
MGRFRHDKPMPVEAPADQTGQHPVEPSASDPKAAKQKRLDDDRAMLATADEAQADGNLGVAQYLHRLIGD